MNIGPSTAASLQYQRNSTKCEKSSRSNVVFACSEQERLLRTTKQWPFQAIRAMLTELIARLAEGCKAAGLLT